MMTGFFVVESGNFTFLCALTSIKTPAGFLTNRSF